MVLAMKEPRSTASGVHHEGDIKEEVTARRTSPCRLLNDTRVFNEPVSGSGLSYVSAPVYEAWHYRPWRTSTSMFAPTA